MLGTADMFTAYFAEEEAFELGGQRNSDRAED